MQDGADSETLNPRLRVMREHRICIEFGERQRGRGAGAENKVAAKTVEA